MNAILEMVPSHRLGTFFAIGNGMIALGPASAPMVTGVMVDAWGWRSVFIVPLVVSVLIGCWGATVPSRMPMPHGPDARFSPRGMVESRGFAGAAVLVVTTMSVYFSLNVMVPLFLGEQVHWESTVAGFCMGPLVVAYALASLAGGRMLDRKGPRPLLPGGLGVACRFAAYDGRRPYGQRAAGAGWCARRVCWMWHDGRLVPNGRSATPACFSTCYRCYDNDHGCSIGGIPRSAGLRRSHDSRPGGNGSWRCELCRCMAP